VDVLANLSFYVDGKAGLTAPIGTYEYNGCSLLNGDFDGFVIAVRRN